MKRGHGHLTWRQLFSTTQLLSIIQFSFLSVEKVIDRDPHCLLGFSSMLETEKRGCTPPSICLSSRKCPKRNYWFDYRFHNQISLRSPMLNCISSKNVIGKNQIIAFIIKKRRR